MPTVVELKLKAKKLKIKGYSKMHKAPLLRILRKHTLANKITKHLKETRNINVQDKKKKLLALDLWTLEQTWEMMVVKKNIDSMKTIKGETQAKFNKRLKIFI